jgi:UDP-glucose 4-epimerase
MRALVTGAAGFIGSHLTDELIRRGWEVVALDSLADGARGNVHRSARFVRADVANTQYRAEWFEGLDLVLHHAAIASVPRCSEDPPAAFYANVQATIRLAEAVRSASPGATFVFASSAAVYGSRRLPELCGEEDPLAPCSVYGASKLAAEFGLLALRASYGFDVRIVRYANVYGPRQPRYVMYDMYRKIRNSQGTVPILGSGRQLRDFVFVSDAVAVTLWVAAPHPSGRRTPIFNVGTGIATSVLEVAHAVTRAMGRRDVTFEPTHASWVGDVDYLLLDPGRIKGVLGAPVPVDEGVRRFVAWIGGQDSMRNAPSLARARS